MSIKNAVVLIVIALSLLGCESTETVNDMGPADEDVDGVESGDETVEDKGPCVIVPPAVAPPTDVDWELIATLQRNPLSPAMFYIFPEQNEAISTAYEAGKHFIFEIGGELREGRTEPIRHYIIQPELPFQDKHKSFARLKDEDDKGVKWHIHLYVFLSEGWYVTAEDLVEHKGIGLGVEFAIHHVEPRGRFVGEGTDYLSQIGVMDSIHIIGRRNSIIEDWARLRVYVSR